jgi:hypothetical protein
MFGRKPLTLLRVEGSALQVDFHRKEIVRERKRRSEEMKIGARNEESPLQRRGFAVFDELQVPQP